MWPLPMWVGEVTAIETKIPLPAVNGLEYLGDAFPEDSKPTIKR